MLLTAEVRDLAGGNAALVRVIQASRRLPSTSARSRGCADRRLPLRAEIVDHVLKSAKPADIPVEQPTRVELVVNRKAAKALGLTLPRTIMIRADHIIE